VSHEPMTTDLHDRVSSHEAGPLRVLVNAASMGTTTGGAWAYLEEILRAWVKGFPRDVLALNVHPSFPAALEHDLGPRAHVHRGNDRRVALVLSQHALTARRARAFAADAVFNATLSAPLLGTGKLPQVTMAHDIRHVERPQEFGLLARRYRGIVYDRAIRRSEILTCGSSSTRQAIIERFDVHPSRVRAVPLGADHVDRWRRGPKGTHGVAFAHWSNKRPETAIGAWADLNGGGGFDRELHIVGASPATRQRLVALAHEKGVSDLVRVRGRLPNAEFQELLSGAAVVLLPSTLEGFGIPVVEAMRLGVPVVVSAGAGMEQAGGSAVLYADPDSPAAFAAHCRRLWADDSYHDAVVRAGIAHASGYTWATTAAATRAAVSEAARSARR
jgi:glycosyltransferase involved in cell wall biosynthesis